MTELNIGDVIKLCMSEYPITQTIEKNKNIFEKFLERELSEHKYNLKYNPTGKNDMNPDFHPYAKLLSDELYLFACLGKMQEVSSNFFGKKTLLNKDNLKLLKTCGTSREFWFDDQLFKVYANRFRVAHDERTKGFKKLLYVDLINNIGKDTFVKKVWGKEIVYDSDISPKKVARESAGKAI